MAARQDLTVVVKTGKRTSFDGPEGVLLTCNPILRLEAGETIAVSVQIQNTSPDALNDLNFELRLERVECPGSGPCITLSRFNKTPIKPGQSFEIIQDHQAVQPALYRVSGTATYKIESPGCAPLTYSVQI